MPVNEHLDLALQLEHGPPFSEAECDALYQLNSRGGSAPFGFQRFRNLEMIGFVGCDTVDLLRDVGHRPKVFQLKSWSSALGDIDGIAQLLPGLTIFQARIALVTDLRPLLELDHLIQVDVAGCPLDEHSYREIYPHLVKKGLVNEKLDESRIRPQEWELMNAFKRRGLKLSAFCVGDSIAINAPGHTVYDNPYGRATHIPLEDAYKVLEDHPQADEAAYLEACKALIKERRGW